MQVILIGSGNIASLIGHILYNHGHMINQVYSREFLHAKHLAEQLGAEAVDDPLSVSADADMYVIAVSDDAIAEIAKWLRVNDKLVIHTAGSVSKEILRPTSTQYGVVWPVKMVRSAANSLSGASIVIDAVEGAMERVRSVAEILSGNVITAGDEKRAAMHMIAVFTVNFSNHLFHLAADYCQREGIDFNAFYPLIRSAVEQLAGHHPATMQAGPAFRGDEATIARHEKLLAEDPQMLKLYMLFTDSITASFYKG